MSLKSDTELLTISINSTRIKGRPKGRPNNWFNNKPKSHCWPQYSDRGVDGIYGITRPVVTGFNRAYKYASY